MQLEAIILRSNYSCLIDAAEVRASRMPVVLDHQLLRTVISTASSPWLSPTSFPTVVAKLFFYLCCCLFFILITKYSGIFLFKYPSLPLSLSLSLSPRASTSYSNPAGLGSVLVRQPTALLFYTLTHDSTLHTLHIDIYLSIYRVYIYVYIYRIPTDIDYLTASLTPPP